MLLPTPSICAKNSVFMRALASLSPSLRDLIVGRKRSAGTWCQSSEEERTQNEKDREREERGEREGNKSAYVVSESISSIKMIEGLLSRAIANSYGRYTSQRNSNGNNYNNYNNHKITCCTSFSPSPTYFDVRFAELTLKNVQSRDVATARAS